MRLYPCEPTSRDTLHWRHIGTHWPRLEAPDEGHAGFTSRYAVARLIYYEMADTMEAAISREKQLKAWRREWKIALIKQQNPFWEDRAVEFGFEPVEAHRSTKTPGRPVRGS